MSEIERISLVLPKSLWEQVKQIAPAGQRSRLVSQAIEAEIRRRQRLQNLEKLRRHQEMMRHKYGELPSSADDIVVMRDERTDEAANLH